MARDADAFRIDIDLGRAEREAQRIRDLLAALRLRHDLARYEYTKLVQIAPAGPTHSHPILTLGTRFAETEDHLLATYLHEQMHWYLWRLGGPDHDPIAPFFDELVRRYPKAPTRLPEGARNYEQTYLHLVVCWLELYATSELIGHERTAALADTQWGYRWIYRTVLADWEPLGQLYRDNGLLPMPLPDEIESTQRRSGSRAVSVVPRKTKRATRPPQPRQSPRKSQGRGGRSRG